MEKVKMGLIGLGNMGSGHIKNINAGKVSNVEITCACDIKEDRIKWAKDNLPSSVTFFNDAEKLMDSGLCDAVLIAVPHYDHPPMAIMALKKGLHTLIEKPAGVYTKAIEEMNEVAKNTDKVFGIMFNQRTNPAYQKIRELIASGELGELKRIVWIITDWYRSQSYYDSGDWRASWAGEGGGVLMNQAPHQLDLWQWMFGMPKRVRAFVDFGKYHDIEVDDDVTAYMQYENGATGVFITTTGEAPGTNRLEVSGEMGKLVYENGKLIFSRTRVNEREFNKTYKGGFGEPEVWQVEIPIKGQETAHPGVLTNYCDAVLKNTPLLCPGIEGINGTMLTNSFLLSQWTDNWVNMPIDADLYKKLLDEKIKTSRYVKKQVESKVLDTEGTY